MYWILLLQDQNYVYQYIPSEDSGIDLALDEDGTDSIPSPKKVRKLLYP